MVENTENIKYCLKLLTRYSVVHYNLIYYTDLLTGNYIKNISSEEIKERQKFALNTVEYLQENMPKSLQRLTDLQKLQQII